MTDLRGDWERLLAGYGVAPAAARPVFDRLAAAYAEPHRAYHTLEHLSDVLRTADALADLASDPSAVRLAIWFHDAVYDPKATDNEERSAELAADVLGPLGVPADVLARVAALIRATAHTAADELDADTDVLLDADLAILGSEPGRYIRYAADVRREYAWVEDGAYRAGRSRVLEGFLNRPHIYRTDRMRAALEEAARRNLRGEIERLRGAGP